VRVDRDRTHTYESAEWGDVAPGSPYAVYLTAADQRFRLLPLELDRDKGDVGESCALLQQLLDEAGITYVVAHSGPTGGRHIWSAWPQGLDADLVRRLAAALKTLAPALDEGPLQNPFAGCVRPPGAPHRHGGVSQLQPGTTLDQAAAILTRGNPSERIEALVAVLPASARERITTRIDSAPAAPGPAAGLVEHDDAGQPRLVGPRRELNAEARRLLHTPPQAEADLSALAWSCLLRLAFARLSIADAQQFLADASVHGLEHLRSTPGPNRTTRQPRTSADQQRMLTRQWAKAVDKAAAMHRGHDHQLDNTHLAALVARVQATADADPGRWQAQAGPCDRLLVDAVCLMVLDHGANPLHASARAIAERAGIGRSTAHRALQRLSTPDAAGRAWFQLQEPGDGTTAATWRLIDPDAHEIEDGTTHQDQVPPAASPETDKPSPDPLRTGGTQGNPPPGVRGVLGGSLATDLRERLDQQRSDVWTPRGGLGHHIARTYAAVQARGTMTLVELCWATGYSDRTILAHLSRLEQVRLVRRHGSTVVVTARDLDEVARELGVAGTASRRRLRFAIEREALAWWNEELAWRRRRGKTRRGQRRGRHRGDAPPVSDAQAQLPVPIDPRHRYGRFPTHATGPKRGRADYTAAHAIVTAHLTRAVTAAAAA
jgi:hypothetical protein